MHVQKCIFEAPFLFDRTVVQKCDDAHIADTEKEKGEKNRMEGSDLLNILSSQQGDQSSGNEG